MELGVGIVATCSMESMGTPITGDSPDWPATGDVPFSITKVIRKKRDNINCYGINNK